MKEWVEQVLWQELSERLLLLGLVEQVLVLR